MWVLEHFPFCPFSRKVRLVLAEKRVAFELYEVKAKRRPATFQSRHTGGTPGMLNRETGVTLDDSNAICEYFEETVPDPRLLPGTPEDRAEARRMVAEFEDSFYAQVAWPLLQTRVIGVSAQNIEHPRSYESAEQLNEIVCGGASWFLRVISSYLEKRQWLAGPDMSLADLAAAAQLSVVDCLGGIDWSGYEQAQAWYSAVTSRPSFQPILAERVAAIVLPPHYSDPDG